MAEPISIQLYDTDIEDLLNGWEVDIRLPRTTPDHLGVFENLQEQELIYAISKKNYRRAYSLLRKLDHILSPADAAAACLCALTGTTKLMTELLDHCPPIPEFQFQGVAMCSSLLNVAAKYDKSKMLDILLQRGANPNGGPTPLTAKSPAEQAFCSGSYLSLKRLLEIPDLQITLTEELLDTWGNLRLQSDDPFQCNILLNWCCQLMLERLTGQHPGPFDLLPIPAQMQLGHALRHGNPELALRICQTRPLTDADIRDLEQHYTSNNQVALLEDDCSEALQTMQLWHAHILIYALEQFPELLNTPWMRFAVASNALALPKMDEALQRWVERIPDGDITLDNIPTQQNFFFGRGWFPHAKLDKAFFPRWDARLGLRLTPALDLNTDLPFDSFSPEEARLVLERIHFTGEAAPDKLSIVPARALLYLPEDMLPELLQPGGLLAQESPRALLDACQALPISRRNLLLPLIHKRVDYTL